MVDARGYRASLDFFVSETMVLIGFMNHSWCFCGWLFHAVDISFAAFDVVMSENLRAVTVGSGLDYFS